jgi:hypothetical protein
MYKPMRTRFGEREEVLGHLPVSGKALLVGYLTGKNRLCWCWNIAARAMFAKMRYTGGTIRDIPVATKKARLPYIHINCALD